MGHPVSRDPKRAPRRARASETLRSGTARSTASPHHGSRRCRDDSRSPVSPRSFFREKMRECPLSSSPSGHTPVPAIPARHFSVTRARERETGRSLPRAHDLRGPPTAHSLQWKPLFAQSPQSEDRSVSLARTGARRNSSNQETGNLEPKWCCASGPARRAQAPREFAGVSVLLAEEHPLKLSRLRRRQSRLREYFHDLISELPLFRGKYRRVAVPTQTSANVLVDPRFFTRDRIRESMQVPDLIEQRLKLFVGNRHDRPGYAVSWTSPSRRLHSCFCSRT
jgi:hypothetical protein